jgi:malonate-semialdehyde dehydrogenase (acetylating) / methylmalonate-semialdehyde dehydrogenase
MIICRNYINGKFIENIDNFINVYSPHDNKIIAKVISSTGSDVKYAISSAKTSFLIWKDFPLRQRLKLIKKLYYLMIKNRKLLSKLIIIENGKTYKEAKECIDKCIELLDYVLRLPSLLNGKYTKINENITCKEIYEPIGVVACIFPFNYPLLAAFWSFPMAIACGNCIILKPSEKVPLSINLIARFIDIAGFPKGVFNIINGGKEIGKEICLDSEIKGITFVGSSSIATQVYKCAIESNKRVLSLEGGNNYLISLPDIDIEKTARDIINSFTGFAGQGFMAGSVLITVGKQNDLILEIIKQAKIIKPGFKRNSIGPIICQNNLQYILNILQNYTNKNSKILLDGRNWLNLKKDGNWIGPTIILHNNYKDPIFQKELFGPILSIIQVKDKEKVIKIQNKYKLGNATCIYTNSGKDAEWFKNHLNTGTIGINVGVPIHQEPFSFGGINISNFSGKDINGEDSIRFFTNRKKIIEKW